MNGSIRPYVLPSVTRVFRCWKTLVLDRAHGYEVYQLLCIKCDMGRVGVDGVEGVSGKEAWCRVRGGRIPKLRIQCLNKIVFLTCSGASEATNEHSRARERCERTCERTNDWPYTRWISCPFQPLSEVRVFIGFHSIPGRRLNAEVKIDLRRDFAFMIPTYNNLLHLSTYECYKNTLKESCDLKMVK